LSVAMYTAQFYLSPLFGVLFLISPLPFMMLQYRFGTRSAMTAALVAILSIYLPEVFERGMSGITSPGLLMSILLFLLLFVFTGMLFAAAHLIQVYRQWIGVPDEISGWTLIIAGTLLGIGLDIIFSHPKKALKEKKKAKKMSKRGFTWNSQEGVHTFTDGNGKSVVFDTTARDTDANTNTNTNTNTNSYTSYEDKQTNSSTKFTSGSTTMAGKKINIENAFGERSKYITSSDFVEANIENGFGTLNVYFENAQMLGAQAAINIDNGFGKTSIYLPAAWRLSLDDDAGFGKIKVHGNPSMDPNAPLIYINASTGFGDINLYFG